MNPTLHHPDRYVWDFWYHYDAGESLFHVFYLNADPATVPSGENHNTAAVGYATTRDFLSMNWGKYNVLTASRDRWDNTCIWSGDIVRIGNGYLLFYTSRNRETHDGQTQNVGAAFAGTIDSPRWEPVPGLRIHPDSRYYEPRRLKDDLSTHAWRDPFLFRHENQSYMLLSAKSVTSPLGRNAAVALLKARNGNLTEWEIRPPLVSPNLFSEMEVTQLYKAPSGIFRLFFSCSDSFDFSAGAGGLIGMESQRPLSGFTSPPEAVLPFSSGLYACRVIPELGGAIVGFDRHTGGLRRSDVRIDALSMDRDFTGFCWKTLPED